MSSDKRGDRQIVPALWQKDGGKKEIKLQEFYLHSNFYSKLLAGEMSLLSTDNGFFSSHQLKLDQMLQIKQINLDNTGLFYTMVLFNY